MKKIKFSELFLVSAWIIFIASGKSMASSIVLMLAGLYELCGVIPKLGRWLRDAKR